MASKDVSKKINIGIGTVAKDMRILLDLKLLKRQRRGRSFFYELDI
jgi:DNA-binding transcriptional ArsR family regulator